LHDLVDNREGIFLAFIGQMQVDQFIFADPIRVFAVVKLDQLAHMPGIGFLGALAFAVKFNGLDGPIVPDGFQCCHNTTPLFLWLKRLLWSAIMAVVKQEEVRVGNQKFPAGNKTRN
jgi:hypothetical protein